MVQRWRAHLLRMRARAHLHTAVPGRSTRALAAGLVPPMSVVWFITKLALFAFVLNVLLRQSYNLIFFLGRRPVAWIWTVGLLGFLTVASAALLGWSNNLVAWACILAVAMNLPPAFADSKTTKETTATADEVYAEMGIPGGKRKYRAGLIAFSLASLISYLLFYGEACSSDGVCVSLARAFLGKVADG